MWEAVITISTTRNDFNHLKTMSSKKRKMCDLKWLNARVIILMGSLRSKFHKEIF